MNRRALRHVLTVVGSTVALLTAAPACSGADVGRQDAAGSTSQSAVADAFTELMTDLAVLSADSMGGRAVGTEGNRLSRAYIVAGFAEAGVEPFGGGYEVPFTFQANDEERSGVNVVGRVGGSGAEEPWIVVTAHYDHLGTQDGQVYNGADDNASGTAGLLAIARALVADPPVHPVALAALDAEEVGLQGARALVRGPPAGLSMDRVALNVNMDMVSRNDSVLFAAGTYHYPFLQPHLDRVVEAAEVVVRYGHDRPDLPPGDDWTNASDHGPFHQAGIPFIYFGVEDHPDYHQPSDDFERVDADFYTRSVRTILSAIRELDANLAEVARASGRGRE